MKHTELTLVQIDYLPFEIKRLSFLPIAFPIDEGLLVYGYVDSSDRLHALSFLKKTPDPETLIAFLNYTSAEAEADIIPHLISEIQCHIAETGHDRITVCLPCEASKEENTLMHCTELGLVFEKRMFSLVSYSRSSITGDSRIGRYLGENPVSRPITVEELSKAKRRNVSIIAGFKHRFIDYTRSLYAFDNTTAPVAGILLAPGRHINVIGLYTIDPVKYTTHMLRSFANAVDSYMPEGDDSIKLCHLSDKDSSIKFMEQTLGAPEQTVHGNLFHMDSASCPLQNRVLCLHMPFEELSFELIEENCSSVGMTDPISENINSYMTDYIRRSI